VQPKKFFIFRYNRVKYTCPCCHIGITTAPFEPQIIPGSCYGDSFVEDVVLSKICDLIPISRYSAMAERQGFESFPTNSFYEFPRHLAIFLNPSPTRLTNETKQEQILQADETRHRMLEGAERKNWYLWSFNSPKGVVFRVEDTRASDIASEFLRDCACRVLISDAYRGYAKALAIVNKMRSESSSALGVIATAYCNAHARNNFAAKSIVNTRQAKRMLWVYKIAFAHYPTYRDEDGEEFAKAKATIERAFGIMKCIAVREMPKLSSKNMLYDALNYFHKYYSELTLFLGDRSIPMHNNQSERTLRNHVIGRKTRYGSHSPDAARDLARIMSIVESCKMLKVNPREFVADAVKRVHQGLQALSPFEFKQLGSRNSS
jgi:transposase